MYAAWNGHNEVVSLLVAHNASLDMQEFYKDNPRETEVLGETAMMLAASYGHIDVVSTLLAHNASVNIQNKSGVSALVLATRNGHNEVVSTLLAHNADIQTIVGSKAIMNAAWNGHIGIDKLYWLTILLWI